MPFGIPWWKIITDPKIRQAAIDSYQAQLTHLKSIMTTPDYIPCIHDKDGVEIPWNDATKALVQAEIDELTQKLADIGG